MEVEEGVDLKNMIERIEREMYDVLDESEGEYCGT